MTMRTELVWRWDDGNGGAGWRVMDSLRAHCVVALISPNLDGECWEARPLTPEGGDVERDQLLTARGFAELEAAHAYCEVHAWERDGETFPEVNF